MQYRSFLIALAVFGLTAAPAYADVDPFESVTIMPTHDTWATHNDDTVHGGDAFLRVGIEPQACDPDGWNPCEDDDLECCNGGSLPGYCAPPGLCDTTAPSWSAHRKFRAYLRFPLGIVPAGEVVSASLRLTPVDGVQEFGGPSEIEVYRLKKIGLDNPICEWNEDTLNDTNGTTWSSLPQNVSVTEGGIWVFDVTKAVQDWLTGDVDQQDSPIQPNCGFHLGDPDFGNSSEPILRWVDFSSKEGIGPPQLTITVGLDLDEDGWFGDCNEEDPDINPGATEVCDGVDNDCDGLIDEEDCDGLDNDCDGMVDEGEDLCGAGMVCIYHQCVTTCEDECYGPYDLKCEKSPDDSFWQVWACGEGDDDPCKDWIWAEDCDPDEFCGYGYCANNCTDDCDVQGDIDCKTTSTGAPFVAECKDSDDDGCLEWASIEDCGPGQDCVNKACVGGCTDNCPGLGMVQCDGVDTVQGCWDSDEDGCLEWTEAGICEDGLVCMAGDCILEGACSDVCTLGEVKCQEDAWGNGIVSECVTDGDGDECTEWVDLESCSGPCGDATSCPPDPIDATPDSYEDVVMQHDVVEDWGGPDNHWDGGCMEVPGEFPLNPGDDSAGPGEDAGWVMPQDTTGGTGSGGGKSGCAAGTSPSGGVALLLLGLLGLALRRRVLA